MAGKPGNVKSSGTNSRDNEFTQNLTGGFEADSSGISHSPTINNNQFMNKTGAIQNGIFGSTRQTIAIASGVLDIKNDGTNDLHPRKIIKVSSESGSTDTIDTIEWGGREIPGAEITLIGTSGETITITHGSGVSGTLVTINCPGDANATLSGDESMDLLYDDIADAWLVKTGAGSGSGSTFPIKPPINDLSDTWSGTQTIDLSATNSHVTKIILDQNLTLGTPSNPPSSGTQIEFEIEFIQDGTGSRTVTQFTEVVETVTISPTADSITIITYRTNDGGTTYHAIPALRGTISLSGGGSGANTALGNLSSVAINTSLISDTDDTDDLGSTGKKWKDLWIERNIRFGVGGANQAGEPTIWADPSADLVLNVATNDVIFMTVQGTVQYTFSAASFDMDGRSLILDADGDTVIASTSDDDIQFSTGSTSRMALSNAGLLMNSNIRFLSGADLDCDGLASLILDADADTYIESLSDDTMQFISGGALCS